MKLKLTIALVVLALVLGMVLAACDDGDLPTINPGEKEKIYDTNYIPYLDKDGFLKGKTGDTSGFEAPDLTGGEESEG